MKTQKSKTGQYIITGIIAVVLLALIIGQTALIYWALKQSGLSSSILTGILVIGLLIFVTLIFVIIDRIKEIAREESDETGQY